MNGTERGPNAGRSYWRADRCMPVLDQTIGEALRSAVTNFGGRTALTEGVADKPRRWTYIDLLSQAEAAARALLKRFQPGEHVAIFAANCPEWVLLEFGTALAGLTLVTVNPALLSSEVAYVLGQSQTSGVIVIAGATSSPWWGRHVLACPCSAR
jgi:fatty-acyl-CoA synthase